VLPPGAEPLAPGPGLGLALGLGLGLAEVPELPVLVPLPMLPPVPLPVAPPVPLPISPPVPLPVAPPVPLPVAPPLVPVPVPPELPLLPELPPVCAIAVVAAPSVSAAIARYWGILLIRTFSLRSGPLRLRDGPVSASGCDRGKAGAIRARARLESML